MNVVIIYIAQPFKKPFKKQVIKIIISNWLSCYREIRTMNETEVLCLPETPCQYYIEKVQYYFLPFLIIFGVFGNTLSAHVILKTKLRKLSSSFYLLSLTTIDSIMLLTIGIQWLLENNIDLYNQPILCQTNIYVSDLCGSLSVWLIVAFTAERFVVVKYPLRSKFLCTVTRAKIIILILLAVMSISYAPLLFIAGLEFSERANRIICKPKESWRHIAVIFNLFDFILSCLVPVIFISLLNSVICKKIWAFSNIRRKMTENFEMELQQEVKPSRTNKSSYKMTKMLLIVSTVCLTMILPSYIMRLITHLANFHLVAITNRNTFIPIQLYAQFLYYLTFGINFVLYCISGQNFRKAVKMALFHKNKIRRDPTATTTDNRTQSSGLFNYQATFRQKKPARSAEACV